MLRRRSPLSVRVAAVLDPVLGATAFGPEAHVDGRWAGTPDPEILPWPRQTTTVIWCASYDRLQRDHPGLPQGHEQEGEPESCVDLVLEFVEGRLDDVGLEDHNLVETLTMVGLDDDARVARDLIGRPAEEVCRPLGDLVIRLLESTARSARGRS